MSAAKLTPLEVLQKRKVELNVKSDALVDILEDNFEYLQDNFGHLLVGAAVNAATSKLPPFVQNLIKGKHHEDSDEYEIDAYSADQNSHSKLEGVADMALNIAPMFAKGIKGLLLTLILRKVKDMVFKVNK